jgi:hypothetical protein
LSKENAANINLSSIFQVYAESHKLIYYMYIFYP